MGITYFHHAVRFVPVFSDMFFLKVIAAGIFFGLCSAFLIETLRLGEKLCQAACRWGRPGGPSSAAPPWRCSPCWSPPAIWASGWTRSSRRSRAVTVSWYAFPMKAVFTSISLDFGGSGGIVTPIFFVGATSGALFGRLFSLDTATFAAIGLVSLLAGAANTPIAASIMAMELFGPDIAAYAAVSCVISFLMTGHRSVYPSQVLSVRKSESLRVELGRDIEEIEASFIPRTKGLSTRVLMLFRTLARMFRQRGM